MQKRALGDQGSFHLQDFLAKRTNGEETAYWIFDELTKLQGKMTQIPCHCRGIPLAKGVKWGYNLLDNVFMFFGENER